MFQIYRLFSSSIQLQNLTSSFRFTIYLALQLMPYYYNSLQKMGSCYEKCHGCNRKNSDTEQSKAPQNLPPQPTDNTSNKGKQQVPQPAKIPGTKKQIIVPSLYKTTLDKIDALIKKEKSKDSEKTHKMSCGHFFQKKTLRESISNQIQCGSNTIKCPSIINNIKCDREWDEKQWVTAAEYSKQEKEDLEIKLSMNLANRILGNSPQEPKPVTDQQMQKKTSQAIEQVEFQIKVKLINDREVSLKLDRKSTVEKLKETIYKNHYEELDPSQTILLLNDSILDSTKAIGDLGLKENISLMQRKADLWQIAQLKADKNKQDEVSCQTGVAIMSCGHQFGRQSMKYLIKAQLSSLQSSIRCPYKTAEGELCDRQWDKKQWVLVAGFTRTQMAEIDEKLSDNWIHQNTKKCPYCSHNVSISGLKTRRVVCPLCNSPDFCFTCLQPWQGSSSICNSEVCKTLRSRVTNSPWERQFTLKHANGKQEVVKTPVTRACPRCRNIIENTKGCKHTTCPCVTTDYCFCFVCLGLLQKGKWPCGSWNTHCGYVAPNQKFD